MALASPTRMEPSSDPTVLPEYSWFSTGEQRDDNTPLFFLQRSADAAEDAVPVAVPPSWTALALTDHLIHQRAGIAGAAPDGGSDIDIVRTIIDPICLGAAGSTRPPAAPRSVRLRALFDEIGISNFRQLVSTRRVVIERCSVLDTLGNEWDAVTSGAVHAEELDSFVQVTALDGVEGANSAISLLLDALVEMQLLRVGGMLNMIRMLRAVREARAVCNNFSGELDEVRLDGHGAIRFNSDAGVTTWTLADDHENARKAWKKALRTLMALRAISGAGDNRFEGCTSPEENADTKFPVPADGEENIVASLMSTSDERESDAVDLALVLGWVVQTGFWSPECLQSSLLLDSVYEAGASITSSGPLRVLGPYAELVNIWVAHGTLELGRGLKLCIDDVGPLATDSAFDHETAGVLGVPRLAAPTRVSRIRVSPGRGLQLPVGGTAVLRGGGGRARVQIVGGALVSTPQWRPERLKMRAELSLRAGLPGGAVVAEMDVGRGEMHRLEEYAVNGMFEGSFGKDAAFWLLAQIRAGNLAVHPGTGVCYIRESSIRKRDDAPLVDAGLAPECVQLLHSYTDGERVFVDFENNGTLRAVAVGRDGFLSVARKKSRYEAKDMSECSIVSRRRMR